VEGKVGGTMEDTRLVEGIVIDKEFSHPQVRVARRLWAGVPCCQTLIGPCLLVHEAQSLTPGKERRKRVSNKRLVRTLNLCTACATAEHALMLDWCLLFVWLPIHHPRRRCPRS